MLPCTPRKQSASKTFLDNSAFGESRVGARDQGSLKSSRHGLRELVPRNALLGNDERHSQRRCQVKGLSPHHRVLIAFHSPVKVTETGLRMCRPEKGRQIDAIQSRAVHSLQSAWRRKSYEYGHVLRISGETAGQFLCT